MKFRIGDVVILGKFIRKVVKKDAQYYTVQYCFRNQVYQYHVQLKPMDDEVLHCFVSRKMT